LPESGQENSGGRGVVRDVFAQIGRSGRTKVFCFFSSEKKILPEMSDFIELVCRAGDERFLYHYGRMSLA
jgi:hypothetical protein